MKQLTKIRIFTFVIFFLTGLAIPQIEVSKRLLSSDYGFSFESYGVLAQGALTPISRPLWKRVCVWIGGALVCSGGFAVTDEAIRRVIPIECQEAQTTGTTGAAGFCASQEPPNPPGCFARKYCTSFCAAWSGTHGSGDCAQQRDLYGPCFCVSSQ